MLLVRPGPEEPPRILAVLPFEDHSRGEARGALGDSISESILTDLARYPELQVIAQNSSFRYRDGPDSIADIAEMLGADLVLEGSQHLDGRDLRVTARLIDARTDTPVWADRMDTQVDHLFDVTTRISLRVANAVEGVVARLRAEEASPDAADSLLLMLKARQFLGNGVTPENVARAVEASRQAVDRYPEEPWGHIGLAFALRMQLRFGWAEAPDAALAEAVAHAETAVRIAPESYLPHYALGRVRSRAGNQFGAIEALERAVLLNPSAADAMNALAQAYFYIGENERAFEVLARSAEIDPLPNIARSWVLALTAWQEGDCQSAVKAFSTFPATPPEARKLEAVVLQCAGDTDGAAEALSVYLGTQPDWTLRDERALWDGVWVAEGSLERWLAALGVAGLPEDDTR